MLEAQTVYIDGLDRTPSIGSIIVRDCHTSGIGTKLTKGETPCPGFAGSMFRLATLTQGPIKDLAVNILITGRSLQRKWGSLYVRVKIVFVGDCEPNTETGGWMLIA
jgi:hypothetical protein